MRIYIAYKYTKVPDKQKLKGLLEDLAEKLAQKGFETFILGRDIQRWGESHSPLHHKFVTIIKNIQKSDVLMPVITSGCASLGLEFELLMAKILNKPVVLLVQEGIHALRYISKYPNLTFETTQGIDIEKVIDLINNYTNE